MGIISMVAVDPVDQDDAFEALKIVDDVNGLVKSGQIELTLDEDGVATLWPKGHMKRDA